MSKKFNAEISEKARQLQEYANSIDNEGITYSYENALDFIKNIEAEDGRVYSLEELKELLDDIKFFGV